MHSQTGEPGTNLGLELFGTRLLVRSLKDTQTGFCPQLPD